MKIKRMVSLFLALVMVTMTLTACGGNNVTNANSSGDSNTNSSGDSNTNSSSDSNTNSSSDSGANSSTDSSDVSDPKYVIGFCMNNYDEAMIKTKEYIDSWDATHPEVEVKMVSAEARLDKQISDAEAFIAMGVDILVVNALDIDGTAPIVDAAHAANIPVVAFGDEINHDDLDLYVGEDAVALGRVQGRTVEMFLEENPDVGTLYVGHILGDLMYAEVQRTKQGLMEVLEDEIESGKIVILDEKTGEWASTKAMNVTEDWLQAQPKMNCIIAMSDEMALGSLQALNAAGKTMGEDMYLFGKDGSVRGITEVRSGQMTGTVLIDFNQMANQKMDIILRYLEGEDLEYHTAPDADYIFAPVLLSNVEETMAAHPQ